MGLKAGKLRHRIDIQQPVETKDLESGAAIITWMPFYQSVPASIEPLSAREFIAAQAQQSQITARIKIRYRPGLTAAMRIIHNGKIYNPQGWFADVNSGLEYLTAPVTEGVNQG